MYIIQLAVVRCVKSYDSSLTLEKALRLGLIGDECFLLPSVVLLATGLQYIWVNSKQKVATTLLLMKAELEAAVSLRRKSIYKRIMESANIMENMINNFFPVISVDFQKLKNISSTRADLQMLKCKFCK